MRAHEFAAEKLTAGEQLKPLWKLLAYTAPDCKAQKASRRVEQKALSEGVSGMLAVAVKAAFNSAVDFGISIRGKFSCD